MCDENILNLGEKQMSSKRDKNEKKNRKRNFKIYITKGEVSWIIIKEYIEYKCFCNLNPHYCFVQNHSFRLSIFTNVYLFCVN